MATEITNIVDPDNGAGTDYTSLTTWESTEQRDLVSADEIEIAKCRSTSGSADTSALNISGWTTDSTRYIKIFTDPAESYRHDGKWNAFKFRVQPAQNNHAITLNESFIKIEGIQVMVKSSGTVGYQGIRTSTSVGSFDFEISYSIILSDSSGANSGRGIDFSVASSGAVAKVWNTIVYDFNNTSGDGDGIITRTGNVTLHCFNCTVHNCEFGFVQSSGTFHPENCLSNCDAINAAYTDFSGTFTNAEYNGSTDATAPGTNSQTSATFTFEDEANDDFHLSSSDAGAKDNGKDLSADADLSFSDDIDGDTRSGSWDIGADEVAAAAGGASMVSSLMLVGVGN